MPRNDGNESHREERGYPEEENPLREVKADRIKANPDTRLDAQGNATPNSASTSKKLEDPPVDDSETHKPRPKPRDSI